MDGPGSDAASRSTTASQWRRWLLRAVSLVLTLVVLWGLWRAAEGAIEEFRSLEERGVSFRVRLEWCLAAGLCYSLSLLPAAWFWGRILKATGQASTWGRVLRAYLVGQIGKYVPGKAFVVILRTALVSGKDVQPSMAAAGVFIETLTMMSVGAALAAGYLVLWARSDQRLLWTAVPLAIIVTVPTLPPFFRPILRLIARRGGRREVREAVEKLGFPQLWEGWAAMLLLWLGFGLSLGCLLQGLELGGFSLPIFSGEFAMKFPALVAAVAFATVGGFLAFFLPGGLGARELLLAAVLAPVLAGGVDPEIVSGQWLGLVAAVTLRIIWLTSEVILAITFWSLPFVARLRQRMAQQRLV